ncbi:proton-coupled folate transporter-like [Anneissia japonica]|uniref:proton-coupled folate transporter-like n=1 Tax=Anneissia japonica TaxID=1529436 RepID=UPI001425ABFA|nr:proton-coupled folate transporter-like [Anneissia japonica]
MARFQVTVELVILIISLAFTLLRTLAVLFTEYVIQLELNAGCLPNITMATCYTVKEVQVLVSNWTTIFVACQSLPALFVALYVSTWSDRVGRKITMVLPTIGYIIATINCIMTYVYALPIEYLLPGNLAIGFSGSVSLVRSGSSSYVSDTVRRDDLTFRLSVLQGVAVLGLALGQLGFSLWIEYSSFLPTFVFIGVMLLLCLLYIVFYIKETVVRNQSTTSTIGQVLSDMIQVVVRNTNNRRSRLIFWLFVRCLTSFMMNGSGIAAMLYFIGPPLLWSTSEIGYFTFGNLMSITLGKIEYMYLFMLYILLYVYCQKKLVVFIIYVTVYLYYVLISI